MPITLSVKKKVIFCINVRYVMFILWIGSFCIKKNLTFNNLFSSGCLLWAKISLECEEWACHRALCLLLSPPASLALLHAYGANTLFLSSSLPSTLTQTFKPTCVSLTTYPLRINLYKNILEVQIKPKNAFLFFLCVLM